MQNSYNKYGRENFKIDIVLYCDIESLAPLEQSYLDSGNYSFNMCKTATNCSPNLPWKSGHRSKKVKDKISNSLKKYYKDNSHPLEGKIGIHSEKGLKSLCKNSSENKRREGKFLYKDIIQMDMGGNKITEHKSAIDAQNSIGKKKPASSKILRACKKPEDRSAYGFK